jgi:hypothetical protein
VCLVDTEGSGDKYAGHPELGPFHIIPLYESSHPDRFAPGSWIEAMKLALDHGIEAIVLDSATHEWQWCLDYHRNLGGRFQDWAKVTPEHDKFIRAILRCPAHVITCLRRKTEYALSQDPGKKANVEKVGLKSEIREGFEYEPDLVFGLNRNHMTNVEKVRTKTFADGPDFIIGEEIVTSISKMGLLP